jgi:predicted esterase
MDFILSKQHSLCATVLAIIISLLLSCSNENNVIETNESVSFQDTCSVNANHSYELYIPGNSKACLQLPLIIIIDPHGDGKSAIKKFVPAANKCKCILASSNLIKNNYENYLEEIKVLLQDVNAKYPTNGKIFLAGFSGGARMALSFGQRNIIDGILACGALATTNQIITIRAPVYALIGMQDFNFIETAQYFFRPENTPSNLRIEISEDMHEWPSSKELSDALTYLILNENSESSKCLDKKDIFKELTSSKMICIEKLKKDGDFLSALQIAKNMALLNKEENLNQFQSLQNAIE